MPDEPTSPSKRAEMADAQGETAGNRDDEVRARTPPHARRRRPLPTTRRRRATRPAPPRAPLARAFPSPQPPWKAPLARADAFGPRGFAAPRSLARAACVDRPRRRPTSSRAHPPRTSSLLCSSLLFSSRHPSAYPERARTLTPLATPSARRRSPAGAWTTTPPRALPHATATTTTSPARAAARKRARTRPAGRNARRRTRRRPPPPRTAARARGTNGVRVAGRPLAVARRKNPGWCGPRSCTCDS